MANWVENKERIGYGKALSIYNELVENPEQYKDHLIFNFLTNEGWYRFTNPKGEAHGVFSKYTIEKIAKFFTNVENAYLSLIDTEYCITYNMDGKPSLFEKTKGLFVI